MVTVKLAAGLVGESANAFPHLVQCPFLREFVSLDDVDKARDDAFEVEMARVLSSTELELTSSRPCLVACPLACPSVLREEARAVSASKSLVQRRSVSRQVRMQCRAGRRRAAVELTRCKQRGLRPRKRRMRVSQGPTQLNDRGIDGLDGMTRCFIGKRVNKSPHEKLVRMSNKSPHEKLVRMTLLYVLGIYYSNKCGI